MIAFLYWLFLTPSGGLVFATYLATTIALFSSDVRKQRRREKVPTLELDLLSGRRPDFRNN